MSENILLYVVRHGETLTNREHRFRGGIDSPLDKQGYRDAHELAHYFEPIEISHIFTSPRKRTKETAKIIGDTKHMEPKVVDDLMAWDIGEFSGLKKTQQNVDMLHQYVENPDRVPPGGESLNHFRSRLIPLINEAIDLAQREGLPVMFMGHSSVIHEVGAAIMGDHMATKVKPGGVAAVYVQNGRLKAAPIYRPDEAATTQNALGSHPSTTTVS